MSQLDFYTILDECVSRLRQGESPEACLANYPAHAAELAPELALTAELFQLAPLEPSPEAVADGYQKMMAALDGQETLSPLDRLSALAGTLVRPMQRQQGGLVVTALRTAAIAVVVLVMAGGLLVTAADGALPGDVLYPVKRSWESTRLTLTVDDSSHQELQSKFERRRREEVQAVLDLQRPVVVEFVGIVESLADEAWRIDGFDLTITDDTQVIGAIAVGQSVTVRAQVKDDGSLNALSIVVVNSEPLPKATPPVVPPPTQTTRPAPSEVTTRDVTATPSPTPAPEKTRPEPTATEKPTDRPTREATSTPAPSIDSKVTREPTPTNTRPTDSLATSDVRPTKTPANTDPTPTQRPVDVAPPTPTATYQPTRDVKPSPTPTATRNTDKGEGGDRPP